MSDFSINTETIKAVLTLLILIVTIYSFIREHVSPDVTALLAILALMLTGILTPEEAFSGFSHPAAVSVAAVLVLSAAIERTGALTFVARRVLAPLGRSEFLLTLTIMLAIGGLSAFINNTAAVAIFIPVVLETCRQAGISPGRVLMPMAHAATIGGMCTLVGTSTNLVGHEFARRQGLPGFSMFELGQVGLPMVAVGFAYILLIGRFFLPRQKPGANILIEEGKKYLAEMIIQPTSPWIGRRISAPALMRDFDLDLVGIVRRNQPLDLTDSGAFYLAGDSLRVVGQLDKVLSLSARDGLELHRPDHDITTESEKARQKKSMLAEVVVLITSGLIGQTLKTARFAQKYNVIVLALRRQGILNERPSTTPLRAGDVLAVEGELAALRELADTRGFVMISQLEHPEPRPRGLVVTLLTSAAVVAVVSFGILPIVIAATAGCAVLILTGCLKPRDAYQAIDLSLIFLLAGSLALGLALDKSGLTALLARGLAGMSGSAGPYLVLAGFFLASVIISELMSNSGTVALLGSLAISVAHQMQINPTSLLVAVTLGSSAAFAMPIGYQTSLMIYGPGGYRMRDFVRMGIVLDLLLAILSLWLIPRFWPLAIQ